MTKETVCLRIEHHAVLFALLARQAVELCGEKGKESILRGIRVRKGEGPADGLQCPQKRG